MEETPKKGLSKGCVVGIVIVGVLAIIVIVGGIWCYVKKDELIKQGMIYTVSTVKTQLNDNPVEGVDLETFNVVADGFVEKIGAEEKLDPEKLQALGLTVQGVASNLKNLSVDDVEILQQALIDYYPELGDLVPEVTIPETEIDEETTEEPSTE